MPYNFHIEPRDVLFLRDARPMEASDAGLGANWPRPDQIWSAFINAFHRRWPKHQDWEHKHNVRDGENKDSSCRFGALKTVGPFPYASAEASDAEGRTRFKPGLYLPCPLDLAAMETAGGIELSPMRLTDGTGTDLPAPLTHAFSATVLGKQQPPQWIHAADYQRYLNQRYLNGETFVTTSKGELYDSERNIGIAMDPETGSTVDGKLYQAEYLRLMPDVRMAVQADCEIIGDNRTKTDVIGQIADEENIPIILGGQQGVALLNRQVHASRLPENQLQGESLLLRWTLLSPAVFPAIKANADKGVAAHPGGWLPNWVDAASGEVRLPQEKVEKRSGESREAWRARMATAKRFSAKLVAARIGKPLAFSGWDLQTGPKPTYLALPAGSVYVFKCDHRDELEALAATLAWNGGSGDCVQNRRSTLFGEKGYGLGVCSLMN